MEGVDTESRASSRRSWFDAGPHFVPIESPPSEGAMLTAVFSRFDVDNDGWWKYEEALAAGRVLKGLFPADMTRDEYSEVCEDVFVDDGLLGIEHLTALYASRSTGALQRDYQRLHGRDYVVSRDSQHSSARTASRHTPDAGGEVPQTPVTQKKDSTPPQPSFRTTTSAAKATSSTPRASLSRTASPPTFTFAVPQRAAEHTSTPAQHTSTPAQHTSTPAQHTSTPARHELAPPPAQPHSAPLRQTTRQKQRGAVQPLSAPPHTSDHPHRAHESHPSTPHSHPSTPHSHPVASRRTESLRSKDDTPYTSHREDKGGGTRAPSHSSLPSEAGLRMRSSEGTVPHCTPRDAVHTTPHTAVARGDGTPHAVPIVSEASLGRGSTTTSTTTTSSSSSSSSSSTIRKGSVQGTSSRRKVSRDDGPPTSVVTQETHRIASEAESHDAQRTMQFRNAPFTHTATHHLPHSPPLREHPSPSASSSTSPSASPTLDLTPSAREPSTPPHPAPRSSSSRRKARSSSTRSSSRRRGRRHRYDTDTVNEEADVLFIALQRREVHSIYSTLAGVGSQSHWNHIVAAFFLRYPAVAKGDVVAALQAVLTHDEQATCHNILAAKHVQLSPQHMVLEAPAPPAPAHPPPFLLPAQPPPLLHQPPPQPSPPRRAPPDPIITHPTPPEEVPQTLPLDVPSIESRLCALVAQGEGQVAANGLHDIQRQLEANERDVASLGSLITQHSFVGDALESALRYRVREHTERLELESRGQQRVHQQHLRELEKVASSLGLPLHSSRPSTTGEAMAVTPLALNHSRQSRVVHQPTEGDTLHPLYGTGDCYETGVKELVVLAQMDYSRYPLHTLRAAVARHAKQREGLVRVQGLHDQLHTLLENALRYRLAQEVEAVRHAQRGEEMARRVHLAELHTIEEALGAHRHPAQPLHRDRGGDLWHSNPTGSVSDTPLDTPIRTRAPPIDIAVSTVHRRVAVATSTASLPTPVEAAVGTHDPVCVGTSMTPRQSPVDMAVTTTVPSATAGTWTTPLPTPKHVATSMPSVVHESEGTAMTPMVHAATAPLPPPTPVHAATSTNQALQRTEGTAMTPMATTATTPMHAPLTLHTATGPSERSTPHSTPTTAPTPLQHPTSAPSLPRATADAATSTTPETRQPAPINTAPHPTRSLSPTRPLQAGSPVVVTSNRDALHILYAALGTSHNPPLSRCGTTGTVAAVSPVEGVARVRHSDGSEFWYPLAALTSTSLREPAAPAAAGPFIQLPPSSRIRSV